MRTNAVSKDASTVLTLEVREPELPQSREPQDADDTVSQSDGALWSDAPLLPLLADETSEPDMDEIAFSSLGWCNARFRCDRSIDRSTCPPRPSKAA